MPYIGRSTDGFGVRNRFLYLASANDTSVSGADANGATLTFTDGAYVDVYLNGVLLKAGTDYNTNTANTIASLAAMAANDEVTVVVYDVFTVGDMVSATSGGTFVGNVTHSGTVTFGSTVSGLDVNGTEIILDADADTSITADTDDQIDIKIAGADDFQFTANTFTAQSGSTIAAQALTATTVTATGDVSLDGGNFVFNESSADKDFRIESNGNANIFVVDGGNDKVGIGGSPAFSTEIISSSTDTSLTAIGASQLVVTNTGSATTNQMAKIALRLADGSLNGNSFIAGLRESSSSRAMSMVFATADTSGGDPAERVRIATGGDVTLTGGDLIFATSGKGINLGVTSNTDANTLDDYEEGTWTASLISGSGITFSASERNYVKIGRVVYINVSCSFSGTSSNRVEISGLPFASSDTSAFTIFHSGGSLPSGAAFLAQTHSGHNRLSGGKSATDMSYTDVNGTTMRITGTYLATA